MHHYYDIEFFWDPVCPFAWITSRWIAKVAAQTGYKVDWRFISLRLLNKDKDYATEFPPNYERGHTAGLRMLRVAAKIRAELGREHMGALYEGYGKAYWDQPKGSGMSRKLGTVAHIGEVLQAIGLPTEFATAAEDTSWDTELDAETALALSRTGHDVGTPIITFAPPDGVSFFGPVISRIPTDEEAVPLWNAVLMLAQFPGFAEIKRSLREAPQLRILGTLPETSLHEDGQGGPRAEALPEPSA
jgi:2-hydroxychromene-2-carboxylate isomerase